MLQSDSNGLINIELAFPVEMTPAEPQCYFLKYFICGESKNMRNYYTPGSAI